MTFIKMRVECAMNRNSSMTATIISPTPEEQKELVEGADIVVPIFDGVLFSGEISRVDKVQMTPDDAPEHYYIWEIEATSDMAKLKHETILPTQIGTYVNYTPGQIIRALAGQDWVGDIATAGSRISYKTMKLDKASILMDLIGQTGYDYRTRRNHERYTCQVTWADRPHTISIQPPDAVNWEPDSLIGSQIVMTAGKGAYSAGGTIISNTANECVADLGDFVPGGAWYYHQCIIIKRPVLDCKPLMSEDAPVKTLVANRELLNFDAIDDKSQRFTKIICIGRSYSGEYVSSELSAIYRSEDDCTYTAVRGDSVLFAQANLGATVVYAKGWSIEPFGGERLTIRSGNNESSYEVSKSRKTSGANSELVTEITLKTGCTHVYPVGSPIYYELSKLYVEDTSKLESSGGVWIGEEQIAYNSTGTDARGQYLGNVVRGQQGTTPYDHPIGVLVRTTEYTESDPHPESPYAIHGQRIETVNTSANVTRGELDRLCTTMLPQGSNIVNTGEGVVPLNCFWKVNNLPEPGYVPLEVGDVITVARDGASVGNYVLQSYRVDFDKNTVTVRLGDYESGIVYKIQNLSNTLTRQLTS